MARRIRFAGQDFNFPTVVEQDEEGATSESVLSDYFPEIKLSFSPKTSRGGRLGRQTQPVTPEVSLRQAEQAAGGAAGGGSAASLAPAATTAPASQVPSTIKVERPEWLDELLSTTAKTTEPTTEAPKLVEKRTLLDFTPRLANPQTVDEAIGYLYETQLGRTPTQSEVQSWAGREEFADKGLSAQEWDALRGAFRESPEYKSLGELVPASTPKDTGRSMSLTPTAGQPSPAATGGPAPAPAQTQAAAPARDFTPTNASPQTPEEAVKYLYQTQLGRTPTASETAGWTANPVFADKGLSTEEWGQLISGFQSSPEYKSLKR